MFFGASTIVVTIAFILCFYFNLLMLILSNNIIKLLKCDFDTFEISTFLKFPKLFFMQLLKLISILAYNSFHDRRYGLDILIYF